MGETDRTVKRDSSGGALAAGALLLAAGVILSFVRLHADDNDASLYALIGERLAADESRGRSSCPRLSSSSTGSRWAGSGGPATCWVRSTNPRSAPASTASAHCRWRRPSWVASGRGSPSPPWRSCAPCSAGGLGSSPLRRRSDSPPPRLGSPHLPRVRWAAVLVLPHARLSRDGPARRRRDRRSRGSSALLALFRLGDRAC
jgi:hypothetical protein